MNEETCETCVYFSDFREVETDPDEVNGYCCHPMHSEPSSEHHDYGGHWTHHRFWCVGYTRTALANGD